jgi:hypothetical protein
LMQIFVIIGFSQVHNDREGGPAAINTLIASASENTRSIANADSFKTVETSISDFFVTITTNGTTNNLGCNPTATAIEAALGTAIATSSCGAISLTFLDGPVIASGCNRTQTRTWTASDVCGASSTASRTVTWIVNTTPPVITLSFTTNNAGCNPTAAAIDAALGSATASSNGCGAVALTVTDGAVQFTGCTQTQTRSWRATDACGNTATASHTISWTVDVTLPVITTTGTTNNLGCNPTASAIDAALGTATAIDNCGFMSITQTDGPVISSGCNRSQTRTWTVTDICSNTATASRTVTWSEDVFPPLFGPISTISQNPDPGKLSATVNITQPIVIDGCVSVVVSGVRSDHLALSDPYPIGLTTITWKATDACSNTSTAAQSIVIGDTQPPVITTCPVVSPQCFNQNSTYSIPALTATDNSGIQSITFAISGATSRQGLTADASGLFNPGTSNILWKVTDVAGNTATCSTAVVVDKVDAAIPDTFAANITSAIGSSNTIYIGFGGTSITLTANAASTVSPNSFIYKWTVDSADGTVIGTGQTITVSPSSTAVFFVSISDVNNCSPLVLLSKQVNVVDIRCGTNKIVMCEPQKNGVVKSVCIPVTKVSSAPPGSFLGQCVAAPALVTTSNVEEDRPTKGFTIRVQPNPSAGPFEIRVLSTNSAEPILLKAIDMTGRVIDVKQNIAAGQVVRMGKDYGPGVFMIMASQGDRRATVKLVKTGN